MTVAFFACGVILLMRKTGFLDRLVIHFGRESIFRDLLQCYYCLSFWINVLAWTILGLLLYFLVGEMDLRELGGFLLEGVFYAFCAAPVVELITTLIILNGNDQNKLPN